MIDIDFEVKGKTPSDAIDALAGKVQQLVQALKAHSATTTY